MGTEYLHLRSIHEAINGNYIFFFPETDTFLFCFFFKPNWSLKKKNVVTQFFFALENNKYNFQRTNNCI